MGSAEAVCLDTLDILGPVPRLAIFASGSGTTAEAVMTACLSGRIPAEVGVLVGNNSASGVFAKAARAGIQARHLSGRTHPEPDVLDAEILRTLNSAGTTHVLLAGYMKKIGPRTLEAFAGRIFNTHPALLPAFGGQGMFGRHVHEAVLESSVATTGATVHLVDADYDTGKIVSQAEVPVMPGDTIDALAERVQQAERELVVQTLAAVFPPGCS
jgi:phosphoribosylglycinamide formyltransferase 1